MPLIIIIIIIIIIIKYRRQVCAELPTYAANVALPAFARRMPLHGVVDRERSGSENVRNVERCVEAESREGLDEADCTIHPQHQRELSSGLDEQRDEAQAENSRSISPVRRAHSSGFAAVGPC